MSALTAHVADYLRLRRALGFTLTEPGHVLPQFVTWLEATGSETITVEAAIAWARLCESAHPITLSHRLGAVRGFARYLRTIDPATEIPPTGLFGKQQRRAPYIYSSEEIERLLQAARQLRPPLRAATYEALLGLLGASGMRVGEVLGLARDRVDASQAGPKLPSLHVRSWSPGHCRRPWPHPTLRGSVPRSRPGQRRARTACRRTYAQTGQCGFLAARMCVDPHGASVNEVCITAAGLVDTPLQIRRNW